MADDLAKDIIRRQERLKAGRGVFESHWQEIAELVHPMRADFLGPRTPGEKRSQKIFDGTAGLAAQNLAAGLGGSTGIRPRPPARRRSPPWQKKSERR